MNFIFINICVIDFSSLSFSIVCEIIIENFCYFVFVIDYNIILSNVLFLY